MEAGTFTFDWFMQTGIIGAVTTMGVFLAQKIAASRFEKKLTEHSESLKHSLKKELLQLETNFSKKHTIYPELYSALVKAESSCLRLLGLYSEREYSAYTRDELERVLMDNRYEQAGIRRVLETFDRNEDFGRREFSKAIYLCKVSIAEENENAAQQYLLLNDLYLSRDVRELSDSVLRSIRKLCFACRMYVQSDYESIDALDDASAVKSEIKKSRVIYSKINSLMRKELGQD